MIPSRYPQDLGERLALVEASLGSALSASRVFLPGQLRPITDFNDADLLRSVVQTAPTSEGDYLDAAAPESVAKNGILQLLVVGQLRVAENADRRNLQAAELALVEELKAWTRSPPAGVRLRLSRVDFSQLADFPHGWIVATVSVGPQRQNVKP